jgi:hypothetical protein
MVSSSAESCESNTAGYYSSTLTANAAGTQTPDTKWALAGSQAGDVYTCPAGSHCSQASGKTTCDAGKFCAEGSDATGATSPAGSI